MKERKERKKERKERKQKILFLLSCNVQFGKWIKFWDFKLKFLNLLPFPQQDNTYIAVWGDSPVTPGVTDGRNTLSRAPLLAECFSRDGKAFHSIFWQVMHNTQPYKQEGESQVWRILSAWRDVLRWSALCPALWTPGRWRPAHFHPWLLTWGSSCLSISAVGTDTGPHGLGVEPRWLHRGR